jgi:hypothetical protein
MTQFTPFNILSYTKDFNELKTEQENQLKERIDTEILPCLYRKLVESAKTEISHGHQEAFVFLDPLVDLLKSFKGNERRYFAPITTDPQFIRTTNELMTKIKTGNDTLTFTYEFKMNENPDNTSSWILTVQWKPKDAL